MISDRFVKRLVLLLIGIAGCFICALLLCPRSLTSYFNLTDAPDAGDIILLYPTEEQKQVALNNSPALQELWTVVQNLKVHYAGDGSTFHSEGKYLYIISLRKNDIPAKHITFDYISDGYILIGERKYQVVSGKTNLMNTIKTILD